MIRKNNLTIEESNIIRDIFRSFDDLSILEMDGNIILMDENDNCLELEEWEKQQLDDSISTLFATLENLQYLPLVNSEDGSFTITRIGIREFSYWKRDYEGKRWDKENDEAMLKIIVEVKYYNHP
jgi:hypothetical protein